MPLPSFGVSVFAFPRTGEGKQAVYSAEWTSSVVSRLHVNGFRTAGVPMDTELSENPEAQTEALASRPEAASFDIFVAGTILPGGNTQARLYARETREGSLIASSEFEGADPDAVLARAVDDFFAKVHHWWFELHRGLDSEVRMEVLGLRTDGDISALHAAIAGIPGVHVTRHVATSPAGGAAMAAYQVFYHGAPDACLRLLAELEWRSASGPAGLERKEGKRFAAVYGK